MVLRARAKLDEVQRLFVLQFLRLPLAQLPERRRLGPPRWAAELDFWLTDLILAKLTQGPAVMIDRPPPPAAPKSDHRSDRPCHPKVAGQTHCLRSLERATTTVDVTKTLLKCQSLRDQGSLRPVRDRSRKGWPLTGQLWLRARGIHLASLAR
jgi:hypothetical protein